MNRCPSPIATAAALAAVVTLTTIARAQQPAVDTSRIGPAVGTVVPSFSGSDQFGRTQTLESAMGTKGAMLVFFRSADW